MVEIKYGERSVYPIKIKSDRIEYIPIHLSDISVRELYDKLHNIPEETTKGVTFEPYNCIMESKDYFETAKERFKNGDGASYIMKLKNYGDFIGTAGLVINWERRIAESGVYIFKEYWGNGYGTERGETMLEIAFTEYNIDTWKSEVTVDNEISRKSIEKYVVENGGSKYGRIPNRDIGNELKDTFVYVIRKDEYIE